MTEINNGRNPNLINNQYLNINKVEKEPANVVEVAAEVEEKTSENEGLRDTGVFGRSQIATTLGADVSKSVDEAVALVKTNPDFARLQNDFFETMYEHYIEQGYSSFSAYTCASVAVSEFADLVKSKIQ